MHASIPGALSQSHANLEGQPHNPRNTEAARTKCGSKPKLSLIEQFYLVMVRLQLGLEEVDLAQRFEVSQSTVSQIILPSLTYLAVADARLPG